MKVFFFTILVLSSPSVFSDDPLLGKRFNHCDTESKYYDWDYTLEYMTENEEFEAEVIREKDPISCRGKSKFAIGRIWKYEIFKDDLITTLVGVKVIITNKKYLNAFNKRKICGKTNWEINKLVNCEGKKFLGLEGDKGHKTIHFFKLHGRELHLLEENGEELKLIQKN